MKKVPFNIYSINDFDTWRKEFFYPVSMQAGETIEYRLSQFLFEAYAKIDPQDKAQYRIATKPIYRETYDFLMKLLMAQKMRSFANNGMEFEFTNARCPSDVKISKDCMTFDLYKGSEDFRPLAYNLFYTQKEFDAVFNNVASWQRMIRKVRSFIRSLNKLELANAKELVFNPNEFTQSYVDRFCKNPYVIYARELFQVRPQSLANIQIGESLKSFVKSQSLFINQIYRDLTRENVSQKLLEKYQSAITDHFKAIVWDLETARKYLQPIKSPVKLYTGTGGNLLSRILSEAVREKGGEVVAFPHGGGICNVVSPSVPFIEFTNCDQFVCLDEKEREEYRRNTYFINEVDFRVVKELGESKLSLCSQRWKNKEPIDLNKISTIMYVVTGFDYDLFVYGGPGEIRHMHTQMNILDFLISLNKKVIFKNRPKTRYLSQSFNHFGYYGPKVNYTAEPFTQILDQADLFVFEAIDSCALYEAMTMTTKPIVIFNRGCPKPSPSFKEILERRCYVVNLFEDVHCGLNFDENEAKKVFGLTESYCVTR
jgi:hypothetical protein